MSRHRTARTRQAAVVAVAATAALAAALPSPAAALNVGSGADGLALVETRNTRNQVAVALVEENGAVRYRVQMSRFGGRGIEVGAGCTAQPSGVQGLDVALCDRVTPRVRANLGPLGDVFEVDPAFPDPIEVDGDLGDDLLRLGAGDDVARGGSGRDTLLGNAGNDDLEGGSEDDRLLGGDGNDRLHATGGADVLDGEAGDDALSANPARSSNTAGTLRGGDGVDTFAGNGSATTIDSRDGIAEQVSCGLTQNGLSKVPRVFAQAVIDLFDQPGDDELAAGGCTVVDRAPRGERTAAELRSARLRLRDGRVRVRIRCAAAASCRGTASVRVGGRAGTARFALPAGRTGVVSVRLPRAAARSVTRAGRPATVVLTEAGVLGARTERTLRRLAR